MSGWLQAAAAGAAAAAAWALLEPLDRRVFRFPYSDVAVLGKLVTRRPGWRPLGWSIHLANGAIFGLFVWALHDRLGGGVFRLAVALALVEHLLTWPLTPLVDRFHPARGAPDIPRLWGSRRAFAQATYRHLLFGVVLGLLASA